MDICRDTDSWLYYFKLPPRHLLILVAVFIHTQRISPARRELHILIREHEAIVGIIALGIDRVLIIGNIHRSKPAQILGRSQSALRTVGIQVRYRVGVEMHLMAHIIERELQGILRIASIHYPILQHQEGSCYRITISVGIRLRLTQHPHPHCPHLSLQAIASHAETEYLRQQTAKQYYYCPAT